MERDLLVWALDAILSCLEFIVDTFAFFRRQFAIKLWYRQMNN